MQIAGMLLLREDTVARVLKRFVAGGLDAIARRTSSGRQRSVAAAWEAELVWMIEVDPLS
jgi:transposase